MCSSDLVLLSRCKVLISDSGGASKEASFVGKKCFFPLSLKVWPELIMQGYINIVDIENDESIRENVEEMEKIIHMNKKMDKSSCFGNGNAAEIIVDTIEKALGI